MSNVTKTKKTDKCHFCGAETESKIPDGLYVCLECLFHNPAYDDYIKEKYPFMTTETLKQKE